MPIMCQHVGTVPGVHVNVCADHVPACGQCGGCALEPVCYSCASMWAVWRVCPGTGVLIMCQHAGSVAGVHWSGCAYHVPACGRVVGVHWNGCAYYVPACGQCGGCALERVCLSCASMWAVWRVCTGAGVLSMRQHVGSAASLERVCLSCRWAVWRVFTGTCVLLMCQHVGSVASGCAYHAPACGQCGVPGTGVLIMQVGSVAGVHWNVCAYHVPACGQCGGRACQQHSYPNTLVFVEAAKTEGHQQQQPRKPRTSTNGHRSNMVQQKQRSERQAQGQRKAQQRQRLWRLREQLPL